MATPDKGSSEHLSEGTPSSDTSSNLLRFPTGLRDYASPSSINQQNESFQATMPTDIQREYSSPYPIPEENKSFLAIILAEEEKELSEDEQKLTTLSEPGTIPPPLAPSVEEAYRRKCIQLRQRTNEVEESNEQSRQRLVLLSKEIQKSRLERAFLLENLAKRTSTNVEDSEGSPSPPPTVSPFPLQPTKLSSKAYFSN